VCVAVFALWCILFFTSYIMGFGNSLLCAMESICFHLCSTAVFVIGRLFSLLM
jgi:hypothetical protein